MAESEDKVVQTRIPRAEYERFRRLAEEEGISIKEALRRAAEEYVERKERVDADDPFFSFHDRVDAEVTEQTDASEIDDDLYQVE